MPVFGAVDGLRRRSQNRDVLSVQAHGEVVGNLPAHGNDDAFGRFKFRYVQNRFQREFIEVQAVAHVVVGRNGFRIAVYHHAPVSFRLNGFNRADAAPVKLHRRPDSVRPGTENDNRAAVFVEFNVVFGCMVRQIQIIRLGGKLRRQRIDLLDVRVDSAAFAFRPRFEHSVFRIRLTVRYKPPNLEIGKAFFLCRQKQIAGNVLEIVVFVNCPMNVVNGFQLVQKPFVDTGQLVDFVD